MSHGQCISRSTGYLHLLTSRLLLPARRIRMRRPDAFLSKSPLELQHASVGDAAAAQRTVVFQSFAFEEDRELIAAIAHELRFQVVYAVLEQHYRLRAVAVWKGDTHMCAAYWTVLARHFFTEQSTTGLNRFSSSLDRSGELNRTHQG